MKIDELEQRHILESLAEEEQTPVTRRSILRKSWESIKVGYILGITGYSVHETLKRRNAEREERRTKDQYEDHLERCRRFQPAPVPSKPSDTPRYEAVT